MRVLWVFSLALTLAAQGCGNGGLVLNDDDDATADDDTGDDDTGDDDTGDDDTAPELESPGPFEELDSFTDGPFEFLTLDPWTVAIRELDDQWGADPWMILMAGNDSAMLLDSGINRGDLRSAIESFYDGEVRVLLTRSIRNSTCGAYRFDEVALYSSDFSALYMDEYHGGWCYGGEDLEYFEVDRWVTDGDVFETGARALEVVYTPGHTSDTIAVWDPTLGWLFTSHSAYLDQVIDINTSDSDFDDYLDTTDLLADMAGSADGLLGGRGMVQHSASLVTAVRDGAQDIDGGSAQGYVYGTMTYYPFDSPAGWFAIDVANRLHDEPFVDGNLTITAVSAAVVGGETQYTVSVRNNGPDDVLGGFYVDVFPDEQALPPEGTIGEVYEYVNGLAGNATETVSLTLADAPSPQLPSPWQSYVLVDTDMLITETDETDNGYGPVDVYP